MHVILFNFIGICFDSDDARYVVVVVVVDNGVHIMNTE